MARQRYRKGRRLMRHARVRKKINGTLDRPRLCVFRALNHLYAQVIDDGASTTVVAASSVDREIRESLKTGADIEAAKQVGELIARRAKAAGCGKLVFDRGGYLYHGRVKALAESAREHGLKF